MSEAFAFTPKAQSIPPCSLCRQRRFDPSCWRCRSRRRTLFPTAEVVAAWARPQAADGIAAERKAQEAARLVHLASLGRPVHVVLVGAGTAMRTGRWPARALYTGSRFRAQLRYAEAHGDEAFILSVRYGLVELDEELPSYAFRMTMWRPREREGWASRAVSSLAARFPGLPVRLTLLLNEEAMRLVAPRLPSFWVKTAGLEGMGQARRRREVHGGSECQTDQL